MVDPVYAPAQNRNGESSQRPVDGWDEWGGPDLLLRHGFISCTSFRLAVIGPLCYWRSALPCQCTTTLKSGRTHNSRGSNASSHNETGWAGRGGGGRHHHGRVTGPGQRHRPGGRQGGGVAER